MWVKLDDGFAEHPRVSGLSDAAFRLHVASMCYAAHYLTDGRVPAHRVHGKPLAPLVAELVKAGLWTRNGTGYEIHDWRDYNPTREDVERQRKMRNERQRRWREGRDGNAS